MAATATGIQVYIGATSDVQKGLQDAVSELRNAVGEMRKQISDVSGETQKADKATGSWIDSLKKYRTEQAQQGRSARFFVDEIASIVPVSKQAEGALRGLSSVLVEGLAGGVGFGLALEGIKLLVGLVRDYVEEAERARTAWAAAYASIADLGKPLEQQLDQLRLKALGLTEAWLSVIAEMQRAGAVQLPTGEAMSADDAAVESGIRIRQLEQEFDAELERVMRQGRGRQLRGLTREAQIAAVRAGGFPELKAILDDMAKWQRLLDGIEARFAELRRAAGEIDRKLREQQASKEKAFVEQENAALDPASVEASWSATAETDVRSFASRASPTIPDLGALIPKPDLGYVQEALRQLEADIARVQAAGVTAGKTIGAAMAAGFGQGEKGVRQMGAAVLDQVVSNMEAYAVEAAANAAAKTGVPWLMPFVAATAFSFVRGLIGQLPARAMGGPVEAGRAYVVGERGPEVLQMGSTSGTVVPNHALVGAGAVVVNLPPGAVYDGDSIYRTMIARRREMARFARAMARYGG